MAGGTESGPETVSGSSHPPNGLDAVLAERPLIVLGAVLAVLVLVTGLIQPGYLSLSGLRNTLLLAAPLGDHRRPDRRS